jgi:phosphatidylglycerol:prolipoprotein diacylglycerol transferase
LKFPVYIPFGSSPVLLHSLVELLAFFVGFRYFLFLKKQQGDSLSEKNRTWVFVGAIFGALIGSRLLGGLENPEALMHARIRLLYFYENKTVVGGFLGGLFGVGCIKKMIGEKQSSGDLFVKPILLALIIGRIGCFSMGIYEETYGLPTDLPWGMNLGDGIRRHPVCLYEIIFLIALWIFICVIERKYLLVEGFLFKIFMISYLVFRFQMDFIKPHYGILAGLSSIQLACLGGIIYYYPDIRLMARMIQFKRNNG